MNIIHRVYLDVDRRKQTVLKSLGISVEKGFGSFDIFESSEQFKLLKPYLEQWGISDTAAGTEYTGSELDSAKYLAFLGNWTFSYPQPEDDYFDLTYDLSDYCSKCGIGAKQAAPFRIRKEPNWRNKKMFQLHWIEDEIFVRTDYYDSFLSGFNIPKVPVLLHKSGEIVESVVQLKIPESSAALDTLDFAGERCRECGRVKYTPKIIGFFPPFRSELSSPIVKTKEWIGAGRADAFKQIVVNQEFRQVLLAHKAAKPHQFASARY